MFFKDNTEQVNDVVDKFFDRFDTTLKGVNEYRNVPYDIILTDSEYSTTGELIYTLELSRSLTSQFGVVSAAIFLKGFFYDEIISSIGSDAVLSKIVRLHKDVSKDAIVITYSYKPLQPYQMRVVHEHLELMDKIGKLHTFLKLLVDGNISSEEKVLMTVQLEYMKLYADVLQQRITNF